MVTELDDQYSLSFLFWKADNWHFVSFRCICLAQRMGSKGALQIPSKKGNSVWGVGWGFVLFCFLICFKVIYFTTLTSGILKLIFVCWTFFNISQPHSVLSCFSCCVPTTPTPISNPHTASDLPKSCFGFSCSSARGSECWGFFCGMVVIKLWCSYLSLR